MNQINSREILLLRGALNRAEEIQCLNELSASQKVISSNNNYLDSLKGSRVFTFLGVWSVLNECVKLATETLLSIEPITDKLGEKKTDFFRDYKFSKFVSLVILLTYLTSCHFYDKFKHPAELKVNSIEATQENTSRAAG
jgi:hypothetical protein